MASTHPSNKSWNFFLDWERMEEGIPSEKLSGTGGILANCPRGVPVRSSEIAEDRRGPHPFDLGAFSWVNVLKWKQKLDPSCFNLLLANREL